MLTVIGVIVCIFVGNESLNISDNRKMVSLSRTFTLTLKIQVNKTSQIVRKVAAVLLTYKQICL